MPIKNMGTATMRFKEGLIATGSVHNSDGSESDYCTVLSGSVLAEADANEENICLDGNEPSLMFKEGNADRARIWINDSDNLKIRNYSTNKHIVFETNDAGTTKEALRIDGSVPEVVVNQGSDSLIDFRVEGNNNTHLIFADGSADRVGIGTAVNAPAARLEVYDNVSNNYVAIIDNDQSTAGHGLKVTSDGTGTGTNIFDVESVSNNLFRVRADGRVGIGRESPEAKLDVNGNVIVSGSLYVNLESDGEALKIVGTLDHENFIVFEQPAGSNRAALGLDSGDNLDITNYSNADDINFFTTSGDTKATMVLTAHNRVGVGKFGWAGKNEYGMNEAFPRDELDVSGSMRVSENVELMGNELVVSGTISGRYVDAIPGHALMFKNTETYFLTTDNDVATKTMKPDENIFFSGSIGSRGTLTKGTAVFGGDLVVSGNMRLAETVTLGLSGSNFFGLDADNEMHVTAGGVLSYKVKNDGNVEFQTAVTSSHFKVEGTGGQFVAFNEDTVKLKHVNWYSSNDRQYGQGQLWYQQWFGAIEPSDSGAQGGRRIGFFFHKPNAGASDADDGSGAHATNTHAYFNLQGMTLQTGSLDVTAGTFSVTGSDGNSGAASFEDYIMAELSIPGLDIMADTDAFTFNCPYDMVFEQMDVYMDTADGSNDLDVDMLNVESNNIVFDINNIQNSGATPTSDTTPANATAARGDRIRFRIANVSGSPQGCRANVRFRRLI